MADGRAGRNDGNSQTKQYAWPIRALLSAGLCLSLLLAGGADLRAAPADAEQDQIVHTVEPGDTILGLAYRYGVSAEAIAQANDLSDPHRLAIGQQLRIPTAAEAPPEPARIQAHRVAPGETISAIAARYGVHEDDLVVANRLDNPHYVRIGQELAIPGVGEALHIVLPGDSLIRIARLFGVEIDDVVQANGLASPDRIRAGQELVIPRPSVRPGRQVAARGGTRPADPPPAETAESWKITYYCMQGRTSSGQPTQPGAVAADASVLPLGAVVEIEGLGQFTVQDRFGRDLGQQRLDVWTDNCGQARSRGIEYRRVWVR